MKKKKSVVYMWVISYVLVLLVPIIFNIFMYIRYEAVLNEQVNSKNESILYNKSKLIDDVIKRAYQLAEMSYSQPEIVEFSRYEQPISVEERYKIYSFARNWFNYIEQSAEYTKNVYVYLPASDMILCRNPMSSRDFFRVYYGGTDEEYKQWKQFMEEKEQKELIPLSLGQNEESFFHVMGAYELVLDSTAPKTVVEISGDVFSGIENDEYSYFYVVDGMNNLVFGEDELWKEVIETGECKERPQMAINKITSQDTGVTYIFMQDKAKYLEAVKNIRLITYIVLMLCVVAGIIIIRYFIRYNSRPIKNIVDSLGYKKDSDGNEFQYIDNVISRQNQYLREDLMIKLLIGNEEFDERILKTFGISFKQNSFITALICINPNDDMFFEAGSSEPGNDLALFAVENVMDELMADDVAHYIFTYSGIIHCIINCSEDDSEISEKIRGIISETNRISQKHLNFTLTAAISDVHNGIKKLPDSYRQVKNILEHRFINNNTVVLESDVLTEEKKNSKYIYSLQNEQKAINCIKSGDYVQAVNVLNEVLDISEEGKHMSLPLVKLLVFNILSTLMRAYEEIGMDNHEELFDKEEIYNRVVNCTGIGQVQEEVEKTLKQFEAVVAASGTKNSFVAKKAKDYIDENFTNSDISVSNVADMLNITSNYMSQVFKKEYGIGLLEYLSTLRIQKVCQMLVDTNLSLEQIAQEVGFSNARALSRSFAKQKGVNPGKYRLIHGTEKK